MNSFIEEDNDYDSSVNFGDNIEVDLSEDYDFFCNNLNSSPILSDLEDLKFRLSSYSETDGTDEYKLGVEQGLNLAAELLEKIIAKYS